MITKETNPWENKDANRAACYAVWHQRAREEWEATKNPEAVRAMICIQDLREAHQKKTGWVAEYQGEGEWVFTYMEPGVRFTGGQPITITTKEK